MNLQGREEAKALDLLRPSLRPMHTSVLSPDCKRKNHHTILFSNKKGAKTNEKLDIRNSANGRRWPEDRNAQRVPNCQSYAIESITQLPARPARSPKVTPSRPTLPNEVLDLQVSRLSGGSVIMKLGTQEIEDGAAFNREVISSAVNSTETVTPFLQISFPRGTSSVGGARSLSPYPRFSKEQAAGCSVHHFLVNPCTMSPSGQGAERSTSSRSQRTALHSESSDPLMHQQNSWNKSSSFVIPAW